MTPAPSDPQQAVLDWLTRPRQEPRTVTGSASGWTATTGGHVPARRETISFVRERFAGDRAMLAVEYDDDDGQALFYVFGVARDAHGSWRITSASGGGRSAPEGTVPWANLGGSWSDQAAAAGGRVHGPDVRHVRLLAADEQSDEDDIGETGIALLLADGPFPQPWTVELYDGAHRLLRTHPFRGGRPPDDTRPT